MYKFASFYGVFDLRRQVLEAHIHRCRDDEIVTSEDVIRKLFEGPLDHKDFRKHVVYERAKAVLENRMELPPNFVSWPPQFLVDFAIAMADLARRQRAR